MLANAAASNVEQMIPPSGAILGDAAARTIAETLSDLTVETYRLLARSQVVHWNLTSPRHQAVNALTGQHYGALFEAIDALAERIRDLGFPAPTGKAALGLDKALSMSGRADARAMVEDLIDDHACLARLLKEGAGQAEDLGDFATHDLLTARVAFHEKAIRMLHATVTD